MNNLTVDNANLQAQQQHHLKPRKSIIGKLERSSFQAQRLSDVGIAFSQQITAKVGLRLPASQERIVEQTRWLYLRYVFVKLRQNGLSLRDLNLTKSSRARRAAVLGATREAQITVSISEPPTAEALLHSDYQRSLFPVSPLVARKGAQLSALLAEAEGQRAKRPVEVAVASFARKRSSALTAGLQQRDLNLLATRVNGLQAGKRHALQRQPECIEEDGSGGGSDSENAAASAGANSKASGLNKSSLLTLHTGIEKWPAAAVSNRPLLKQTHRPMLSAQQLSIEAAEAATRAVASKKFIMDPTINNQIFTVITSMIRELRDSWPEFYGDTVYEVIGLDKFASLESLLEVQMTICQEMTRHEISWERIIALFSLFGAMSLDCVRLGAPEHVGPILDAFVGFVERDLALWISQQGGWESFLYKFRAGYHHGPLYKVSALSASLLLCWALLFVAYK